MNNNHKIQEKLQQFLTFSRTDDETKTSVITTDITYCAIPVAETDVLDLNDRRRDLSAVHETE